MQPLVSIACADYAACVPRILDAVGAGPVLAKAGRERTIVLKPNLVMAAPPPVTTPPELTAAVLGYVRDCAPKARVVIAEGCGEAQRETSEVFAALGYDALAARFDVPLVDLNHEACVRLDNPNCAVLPRLWLPELAVEGFIVSLPVLKRHSLAMMTGTIKNMVGLLPPEHYRGDCGTWKKNSLHARMQGSLADLATYRLPDVNLMDATRGLADHHLGGSEVNPPPGVLLAGFDPYALDRAACALLGLDWRSVPHLCHAKANDATETADTCYGRL